MGTDASVEIVPVGDVDSRYVTVARRAIREAYDLETTVADRRPVPAGALDETRDQYRADAFLFDTGRPGYYRLAVTDLDLFYGGTTHVFGLAGLEGGGAALSVHRLLDADERRVDSRVRKQARKQTGRLLGLEDCEEDCVMAHSTTLGDLDEQSAEPCLRCRAELTPGDLGDALFGGTGNRRSDEAGGRAVAPTRADIEAVEAAEASAADRKDVGEQLVDEAVSTGRFVLTLATFVVAFLVVGAGLFWLVEDVAGVAVDQVGRYGVIAGTLVLALVLTRTVKRTMRTVWSTVRD